MGEDKFRPHYQPYFCEENVWHLAQAISGTVLLISNVGQAVAIYGQKLGSNTEDPIIWDYHVVLASQGLIYDQDSRLEYPCSAKTYLDESFQPQDRAIHPDFQPSFRLIPSEDYRSYFHSDRSHMKNEDGEWLALKPPWAPITNVSAQALRLQELIDFTGEQKEEIRSLTELMDAVYRRTGCGWAASLIPPTPSCP